MSESAALERGYRRLLACYPQPFRSQQAEEMLAVLMTGAQPGQRRPRLAEAAGSDQRRAALPRPCVSGPGTSRVTER